MGAGASASECVMGASLLDINDKLGQHAPSWYAASAKPLKEFAEAEGNLKFDVCIVGAGFSGLSSALHLSELGYNPDEIVKLTA